MRAIWLSDLHFNFVSTVQMRLFIQTLKDKKPEVVIISGDISTSSLAFSCLESVSKGVGVPVLFVLGNHDYYGGSIVNTRLRFRLLGENMVYLSEYGVYKLTDKTVVIGHDGWGDGRVGSGIRSNVALNDFTHIKELSVHMKEFGYYPKGSDTPKKGLFGKLGDLGDEAANHFEEVIPEAMKIADNIAVVTHVPPFVEASMYAGKISSDEFQPHFVCRASGDVLRRFALENPNKKITVFCGHTHHKANVDILPNLKVMVAEAQYGDPWYVEVDLD